MSTDKTIAPQNGVPKPNYTQIPNVVLEAMPYLPEAALKCMLVISRKTFGFHKNDDRISLTQFSELTGLSRPAVTNGLEYLSTHGWIRQIATSAGSVFELKMEDFATSASKPSLLPNKRARKPALPEEVNKVNRLPVNEVNTQKKEEKKERKEEKEYSAPKNASPVEPLAPDGAPASPTPDEAVPERQAQPAPKTRAPDPFFDKLVQMTGKLPDLNGALIGRAKKLLVGIGATLADLDDFAEYWAMCDWRGQKNQKPTPMQITAEWGLMLSWREGGKLRPGVAKRFDAAAARNAEVTVYKGEAEAARFEAEERAKNPDYDKIPF